MMEEEVDATFRKSSQKQVQLIQLGYFPGTPPPTSNPGDLPTCYLSEVLATTMQQRVEIPMAATTLESGSSQAQASMSSLPN